MKASAVESSNADPAFIVFSDDWGGHPSSCQHLFRHIAATHQVLWVNTIGMRRPRITWSDLGKAWRKVWRMLQRGHRDETAEPDSLRLRVCQPIMLPFSALGWVRRFNRKSVTHAIRRRMAELHMVRPVLVSTVPNACDYVGHLNEAQTVYYCVDDFSQWPGFEQKLVREMEQQLIAKADVLVATSHKLYQKLLLSGKPTQLLTHGVDIGLFSKSTPIPHRCLHGIPGPRVGYFGLIDERSDQRLIKAVASEMKDFSFVMTGPVVTDISALETCSNIHFTGPVAYAELPALVAGLDALFLPYLVNDFTDSISPLKLKEYLVTGKPVIATPMAETISQRPHVITAAGVEEWKSALQSILTADIDVRRKEMMGKMMHESWENKAGTFLGICRAICAN